MIPRRQPHRPGLRAPALALALLLTAVAPWPATATPTAATAGSPNAPDTAPWPALSEPWPASRPLPLDEALARALAHSAAMASAGATAQAARGQAETQSTLSAPVLKYSVDRDRTLPGDTPKAARSKFELSWSPPQMGEPGLRERQLQQLARQGERQTAAVGQRLAWQVRQLHTALGLLQAMGSWSQQARTVQARLVDTAERQVAAGRRTLQSLIDLQKEQLAQDHAHDDLLAEQAAARRQLLSLIGQPDDARLTVPAPTGPLVVADAGPAGTERLAAALRQRPELQAAEARCAATSADLELKSLDNGRWLKSVGASYSPTSGGKAANVGLTLEVNLPVPGDRNGSDASLQALRRACSADREALANSIADQVRDAEQQQGRAARAARLQMKLVAKAQEALALVKAARAASRADESEVQTAELAVAQGHLLLRRRLLDAETAELAVQGATGEDPLPKTGNGR